MAYPLAEQRTLQRQKVSHSNIDTHIALNDLKNLTMYGFNSPNTSSYLEDYTDYIKALGDIDINVVLAEFKKDAPDSISTHLSGETTGYYWPRKKELILSERGITKNPHHSILPHEVSHVLTDVDKIFGDIFSGKDEIYARQKFKDLESSIGKTLNELTKKTGEGLYEDIYGVWGSYDKKGKKGKGHSSDRSSISQGTEFLAEYLSKGKDWKEDVIEKTREDAFETPYESIMDTDIYYGRPERIASRPSRGELFSSFPANITDIVKLIEAFENAEKIKAISKTYGNFPDKLWGLTK